ncbi:hypothetical protein [Brevundimonas lutea]|uniref:hypothetical protein n=1 Tax=Brevundimonas lutea TaxID=2293980 RepID=UPI000F02DF5C|nr:hypothetical protein [Brevundimonas lutea]
MTSPPLTTCRRALREIREIAAVAALSDSRMTDQEALQSISAIAQWVRAVTFPERGGAECGLVVRKLNALLVDADLDQLDEDEAMTLFGEVESALRSGSQGALA